MRECAAVRGSARPELSLSVGEGHVPADGLFACFARFLSAADIARFFMERSKSIH